MKNYIVKGIGYVVTAIAVGFGAMGCQQESGKVNPADFGRNPKNNFLENWIVDVTYPLVGCLDQKGTQKVRIQRDAFIPDFRDVPDVQRQRREGGIGWYSLLERGF